MKKEYLYLLGGVAAGYASNMLFNAKGNISDTEAKDFVNKWIKTVNENNLIGYGVAPLSEEEINTSAGAVADLYCVNATLVSTVGDVIYSGRPEIKGYFKNFLSSEPQGTLNSISIQNFGDVVVANGNYTFSLFDSTVVVDDVPNAGESVVPARFTYVLKRASNGMIKIQTHHSSAQPE